MTALVSVFGQTPANLTPIVGGSGRAKELWRGVREGLGLSETSLSERARERITGVLDLREPEFVQRSVAQCGTTKLLSRLRDGREIETVLIPGRGRTTVCISSQVGCARGCIFCVTATMNLTRSLTASEVVAQIVTAMREARERGMLPVRNVVFMGMGEPLDNFDETEQALRVMVDPHALALAPRYITVSTVGPSPRAILAAARLPAHLAWSVHAVDDTLRKRLVPTTKHSMRELGDAFRTVASETNRRLFIEVTLIRGVNDGLEHARALSEFFADFSPAPRFNLLPLNVGRGELLPSDDATVRAFAGVLMERGYFCAVRTTRGDDENAACGQLATASVRVRSAGAS